MEPDPRGCWSKPSHHQRQSSGRPWLPSRVSTCSFRPTGRRERLAWPGRHAAPTLGSREGRASSPAWPAAASVHSARGRSAALRRGRECEPAAPALCPCPRASRMGLLETKGCRGSRIGWASCPSSVGPLKKQNKPKGEETNNKKKHIGQMMNPNGGLWLQIKLKGGGPKDITQFPYRPHFPLYPGKPTTRELGL